MMETRYNCVFAVIQKVGPDTTRDESVKAPEQFYRIKQQQQHGTEQNVVDNNTE